MTPIVKIARTNEGIFIKFFNLFGIGTSFSIREDEYSTSISFQLWKLCFYWSLAWLKE